jgi:hypothetical protein
VTVDDAEAVVDRLEDRDDGVGGAAGGGEDGLLVPDQVVVDAVDDVGERLKVAFSFYFSPGFK